MTATARNKSKSKKKNNKNKILFRYGIVAIAFLVLAITIVVRLFDTTVVEAKAWNDRANKDFSVVDTVAPERGNILASNGNILACNVLVYDTKVDLGHGQMPKPPKVPWKEVDALADSLDKYYPRTPDFYRLSPKEKADTSWHKVFHEELEKPVSQRSRRLKIVKKGSSEDFERIKNFPFFEQWKEMKGFRNPVYTETHTQRINPYGNMARRSVGRVSEMKGEMHGYSGVERDLDSMLYGKPGIAKRVTLTRGVSNWLTQPPIEGFNIQTTFDIDLQDMLEEELTKVCTDVSAEWGTAILMEVATGEIKAIANVQAMKDGTYGEALNRALRGFEPGSVMKPISLMIAFEDGLVKSVNDPVDCSPFQKTTDPHGGGMKTMKQVIEQSSNTGISRVIFRGYADHPEKFYDRLASIGFFEPLVAGISYKETPMMRRLTEYDKRGVRHTMTERHLDLARQAYGYTTTIPPIYTLAVYNAIANGGKYVRPHVMRRFSNSLLDSIVPQDYVRERICSEATAEKVRICLKEPVWGEHGTAKMVRDDRVTIAGKTGTAYPMMSDFGGGYDHSRRRYAFCGFFPYEKPKYSCMVLILANSGTSANRTSGQVLKNVAVKMYARGMLDNVSEFDRTPTNTTPLFSISDRSGISDLGRKFRLRGIRTYKKGETAAAGGVPDVTGYDAASAVRTLERAGYNVRLNGAGHVTSQAPAAGAKSPKGSKIILNLSI